MATIRTDAELAEVAGEPEQQDRLAACGPKTTKAPRELKRFYNVEETARRYGWERVNRMLDAVFTADDLALEVVEDFSRMKGAAGRRMLVQALDEGIESVPDAPDSLKRLFEQLDNPPEWVDWEQLRRGSIAYYRSGPLIPFVFLCARIGAGVQAYGLTRPLAFTGRFEEYADVRSRETVRWMWRPRGLRACAASTTASSCPSTCGCCTRWRDARRRGPRPGTGTTGGRRSPTPTACTRSSTSRSSSSTRCGRSGCGSPHRRSRTSTRSGATSATSSACPSGSSTATRRRRANLRTSTCRWTRGRTRSATSS